MIFVANLDELLVAVARVPVYREVASVVGSKAVSHFCKQIAEA